MKNKLEQEVKESTSKEVLDITGISYRQLLYWELKGFVKPLYITIGSREFKRYSDKDIEYLSGIKNFLDEGYTLEGAVRKALKSNQK